MRDEKRQLCLFETARHDIFNERVPCGRLGLCLLFLDGLSYISIKNGRDSGGDRQNIGFAFS